MYSLQVLTINCDIQSKTKSLFDIEAVKVCIIYILLFGVFIIKLNYFLIFLNRMITVMSNFRLLKC